MLIMNRKDFEGSAFAIQLIAKGSYIDSGTGDGKSYLIETFTIRLNHVALNAWIFSETMNCREVYDTDEEWEAHKAKYKARRDAWNTKVIDALGIDNEEGSACITQSLSEIFSVVHIREIA